MIGHTARVSAGDVVIAEDGDHIVGQEADLGGVPPPPGGKSPGSGGKRGKRAVSVPADS
jgi:hypothetical protein